MNDCSIVWFRTDLRLADNPALQAALKRGRALPVFIYAPEEEAPWVPGGASLWWLHQSLKALNQSLQALGSRLVMRRGPTLESLLALARETGAKAVCWNRRYEPAIMARDTKIEATLIAEGLLATSFSASLLHEPWTIRNRSGKPFQVFTPFWRHCLSQTEPEQPLARPRKIPPPRNWPASIELAALELEPRIHWAEGLRKAWLPGEAGARAKLKHFLQESLANYGTDRNQPGKAGTSRLSPHLHFGEITPRQIWNAVRTEAARRNVSEKRWRWSQFLTELGWREFSHHLLYYFPQMSEEPLREKFKRFPWHTDRAKLKAWQKGVTGYPMVDAGMRELWTTGWMHNRVRMIVASFLVKDLMISWQEGARWFWDTLVDADLAQNTLGWQWTAGCGADAAPFFRVFNPITQGEKFDPEGGYIRRWCPELAKLPNKWLFRPWQAPPQVLAQSEVELGRNYPEPIVRHEAAREIALRAFAGLKEGAG